MSASEDSLRVLDFGTIPTPQYLFAVCSREAWTETTPAELHRIMTEELNRHGPTRRLETLLQRLGFAWRTAPESLAVDVSAVADALERKAP